MRSFWTYSLLRMLLLMACLVLFYLFGARGMFLLATAAIASMLLSYLFLRSQRNRLIEDVRRRQEAAQHSEDASIEDAAVDNAHAKSAAVAATSADAPEAAEPAGDLTRQDQTQGNEKGA